MAGPPRRSHWGGISGRAAATTNVPRVTLEWRSCGARRVAARCCTITRSHTVLPCPSPTPRQQAGSTTSLIAGCSTPSAASAREITFEGRKLVGSAQWRHDGAVLQHGSILIRDDQPLIGRLLKEPPATMETPRAASLRD